MKLVLPVLISGLLAGCSLAPPMPDPGLNLPTSYKETKAAPRGEWKLAAPADHVTRGAWWKIFRDPVLDGLAERASANNQNLRAALARLERTRALVQEAKAAQVPRIDLGAGASRVQMASVPGFNGFSENYGTLNIGLTASYEVDLFGRIRDSVRAAQADLDAQKALLFSLLLSIQADVAETYFIVRALDEDLAVLNRAVQLRQEALQLLRARAAAGQISDYELHSQIADLETTRAEVQDTTRARAKYEHALAILCGSAPAQFTLSPALPSHRLPEIPVDLPSTLLERRPDIAAAQRRMVAANARIGVAKAAFYPVLNLSANVGLQGDSIDQLFKWGSRTWALGPIAGPLLSLPIFEGGRNRANLAASAADLEAEIATYRQTVLSAFGEIEDGLSGLRTLTGQLNALQTADTAAEQAYHIALSRYTAGATGYLEVLDARRTLIALQRLMAQAQGVRATTTVALIRALGGGW